MSAFWCERAWLGGTDVAASVLIDVEGERIVVGQLRASIPRRTRSGCAAS